MQKQIFLSWLCCWDCLALGTGICPSLFFPHYIDHISSLLELSPKVLNTNHWSRKQAQVKLLVKLLLAFLARKTARETLTETSSFCIVISLSTCSLQLKRNTSVLCTIPSAPASQKDSLWDVKELCGEQHGAAAPPHCLLFSSCPSVHTWEQLCCWCQEQMQGTNGCSMDPTTTNRYLHAMAAEWCRVVHQNSNSGAATLLRSQCSRAAWRGLRSLYYFPYEQTMVKTMLHNRDAWSLTSSSSIIYYLSSAGIAPKCSGNKTQKIQAQVNLLFFQWMNKAEAWLWHFPCPLLLFFFSFFKMLP